MSSKAEVAEKNSALFLVVLGPLSLLLSLSLLILKAPQDLFFLPLVALFGITLTWSLRLKGFLLAIALLIGLSFSQIIWLGEADSIWFVGSVFTVAVSFFITWLTLEEAEGKFSLWRQEALDYLSHFGEASKEKELLAHQLEQAKAICQQKVDEIASLEKLLELSRVELLSIQSAKEEAGKELTVSLQRLKGLEEQIKESQETYQEELEEQRELAKRLAEEVTQAKAISREKSDQIDTLLRERDLLESTLNRLQGELEAKELALSTALATPKVIDEPLPEELVMSDSEFRRLWGQLKQLREQFKEKSEQLDLARKELFQAQEKVAVQEREFQERELAWKPVTQEFHSAFEELSCHYDRALDEIERLQQLIQ